MVQAQDTRIGLTQDVRWQRGKRGGPAGFAAYLSELLQVLRQGREVAVEDKHRAQ